MARDASIVATLRDQVSANADRIGDSMQRFSKDVEETDRLLRDYGKRQDEISRQTAKTQTALDKATDELKKAKKAYAELNDEGSEKDLEEAHGRVNQLTSDLKDYKQAANDTQRSMRELNDQERKLGNSGGSSVLGQLAKAGLLKMVGDSLADVANVAVGSAFGDDVGGRLSSALSGAATGAAMGSLIGMPAVGAAIGGLSGAISGATQIFERQDDAYKSYVQDQYNTAQQQRADELESGTGISGGREQTHMAFNKLLGGPDTAEAYLGEVESLAAKTNYTYDEITGYTKKLLNSFASGDVLNVLMDLSDATAALSLSASDVDMFVSGLNRMRISGKATREYLNYFDDRGLNTSAAIAEYRTENGKSTSSGDVAELVTKGKVTGDEAVSAILAYIKQEYGGLSDDLAGTYDAMKDNLGDVTDALDAAMGDAYNSKRKDSLGADISAYGDGDLGVAMRAANAAIGTSKAYAENTSDEYMRQAMSALLLGTETTLDGLQNDQLQEMHKEYERLIKASEAGDETAGLDIETLKSTAEGMAESAYGMSDVGLAVTTASEDLVENLQELNATIQAWKPGYSLSSLFTQGMGKKAWNDWLNADRSGTSETDYSLGGVTPPSDYYDSMFGYVPGAAYGLNRVPKDNFPVLLHEDERVLTANQARQQDGESGRVTLNINGPVTVREEADLDKLALKIAQEVIRAKELRVP